MVVSTNTNFEMKYITFRFPVVSLEFFIDIILPASLWPLG